MSLITSNRQLFETIESLERRIQKHETAIQVIKKALKENKTNFQSSVAEQILNEIEKTYK